MERKIYELNGYKWCLIPEVAEVDLQTETVGIAIPYDVVEGMYLAISGIEQRGKK